MSLFDRGDTYRLEDREPEKVKKERTIRSYQPPKPLSWLSCGILIALGVVMLGFSATLFVLRFAGTETDALVNTRLDENGEIAEVPVSGLTNMVSYTYRDGAGALHAGTGSLFGNTAPFGDTIPVRYFPPIPSLNMLSFRTEDTLTPFGSLFLGVIMIWIGVSRLREIRKPKNSEET